MSNVRPKPILLLLCLGLACLALRASLSPARAASPSLAWYPYLQQLTDTGVVVLWTTTTSGTPQLRYARGTNAPIVVTGSSRPLAALGTHLHRVALTGLQPNTRYTYQVYTGGEELLPGEPLAFQTAPTPGSPEPFSFLAFGDYGFGSEPQIRLRQQMARDSFSFILTTGDNAYQDGTYAQFDAKVFRIYQDVFSRAAFFPTLGNHDVRTSSAAPYLDLFELPTNAWRPAHRERYYSFDYGNAHFVALDSTVPLDADDGAASDDMFDWLRQDLSQTTRRWTIVALHHAPYATGGHGSDPRAQAKLLPIFEAYGVDLVLAGHDHLYQRSRPLRGGQVTSVAQGGIVYVVSGAGEAAKDACDAASWLAAAFCSRPDGLYSRITVAGDRLTVEAIDERGAVEDHFTMPESAASPTPTTTATPTWSPNTVRVQVVASADDAEERASDGAVALSSTDLELVDDTGYAGPQIVGLRFRNVTVPPGARITRAFLEFEVDESDSAATSLLFQGEASDNALAFGTGTANISGRSRTAAAVRWENVSPWTVVSARQQSPDLAPIVQEIVNRPGWASGQALAFIVTGSGERAAKAYETAAQAAPLLHVEYATAAPSTPTATATASRTPSPTRTRTPTPRAPTATSTPAAATPTTPPGSFSFAPVADTHVREDYAGTNYGTSTTLRVDGGSDPDGETYLRFDLAGLAGAVQRATLRLYTTSDSRNGPAVFATSSGWAERTLTWNNRPGRTSSAVADSGVVPAAVWLELDVTALVTGDGSYDFILATDNSDGLTFSAREGSNPPRLVVTLAGSPPGSTPTATATRAAPTATAAPVTIEARVMQRADDVEERASDGAVLRGGTDLELINDAGWEGPQLVGVRFAGLAIPPGATITHAYIEFETDETDSEPTTLTFHGQASDSAPGFLAANFDLSSRARTAASVAWTNVPAWTLVDQKHRTPDLARIVQEIVNRAGWRSGNAMAFIVSGTGQRTAEAYDGEPPAAPLLHVEYTGGQVSAAAAGPTETPAPLLPYEYEREAGSLWLPLIFSR